MNILIIEDNPIIAMDIQNTINDLDEYSTVIVADMKSALSVARSKRIDIVLTDIHIKGDVDGIDTARILQSLYQCAIVFLTSYSDNETLKRAVDVDFSNYLLKPFNEEDLIRTLRLCAMKIDQRDNFNIIANGYKYDNNARKLFHNETLIILTNKECQLFLLLFNSWDTIVSFEIIDHVLWSGKVVTSETRRQLIFRLKQKLKYLKFKTVRNEGCKLTS